MTPRNATKEIDEITNELEQVAADLKAANEALDRIIGEEDTRPDYKWEDYKKHQAEEDARIKQEYES